VQTLGVIARKENLIKPPFGMNSFETAAVFSKVQRQKRIKEISTLLQYLRIICSNAPAKGLFHECIKIMIKVTPIAKLQEVPNQHCDISL